MLCTACYLRVACLVPWVSIHPPRRPIGAALSLACSGTYSALWDEPTLEICSRCVAPICAAWLSPLRLVSLHVDGMALDARGATVTRALPAFWSINPRHQKFANSEITSTLLAYLSRYREFSTPEKMKRVVSLIHRQAVRAKAEGLFFNVRFCHLSSFLSLFPFVLFAPF